MPKKILIDEFHLMVHAPRGLTAIDYDAMRQTLDTRAFRVRLRRAVQLSVQPFPALRRAIVTISR